MSVMHIIYEGPGLRTLVDADNVVVGRGPDGNYGQRLMGFCITPVPRVEDYPESYRRPKFYNAGDDLPPGESFAGYYAQFVDAQGRMYGWAEPIERVDR